ncbi:MAG: mechanosensitive ion channel [Anaerolineae bacterium]|nr:mechanosensitive ion channel [Anaerolineae bacterium]
MDTISTQFSTAFGGYLPRLLGALVLIVVALVVARLVRAGLRRLMEVTQIERRVLSRGLLTNTVADLGYYLVLLLFLPAILDALQLGGLLTPVQTMINRLLAFLPNLLGAALILVVGVLVARIVRRLVTDLLSVAGADTLGNRLGLSAGGTQLSDLIGLLVYVLILIPAVTAAMDALGLPAITQPISNMLSTFLNALPNIFGAALLLGLAYVAGRLISSVLANLLTTLGLNRLPAALGLGSRAMTGTRSLADIVAMGVMVTIMLFAGIEAARLLGFATLATLLADFLVLAGQIVLGLIIFAVGLYIANGAYRAIYQSGMERAGLLGQVARAAILYLAGAMALRQMGLANEIINLAFGLLLGAIAVAAALAFGLGGREEAARVLEDMRRSARNYTAPPPPPTTPPMTPPSIPPTTTGD